MCSSEYKKPDFVIVCVFVLYVEITHLAGPIWSIVARHHTRVSEILFLALRTLSLTNNSSSDRPGPYAFAMAVHKILVRLFDVSLRSQAPQQQYTVHCTHYGITLWAYLSELLVKDSHKRVSSTEKPHSQVT